MLAGVLATVVPVGETGWFWAAYVGLVCVLAGWTVYGSRKFESTADTST